MAGERVQVVGAYGERGSVDAKDVEAVVKAGGRVATPEEIARARLDEKYAQTSTASKIGGALIGSTLAPELQAWREGAASGLSAGTYQGLVRQAVDEIAGKKAGSAYEEHIRDLKTGHSGTFAAGEVGGMIGGAAIGSAAGAGGVGLGARLLPGAGISALGGAVESGVARALGGVAARGFAGRALTAAASYGAQGLVEGALYGAGQQLGEDMLADKEAAADRLFAATGMGALYGALGGAVVGGGGSLLKSGVTAAARKTIGGIARMAESAEAKAAARVASEELPEVGYRTAAPVAAHPTPGPVRGALAKAASTDVQKGWAYDQAWKAVGAGYGLQTTRYAKEAAKHFANEGGTKALGEVAIRHGIIDVTDNPLAAAMNGSPADMVPKIQSASESVGQRIGELTMQSGATVPANKLDDIISKVASPYERKAGQLHVGQSVRDYGDELAQVLGTRSGRDTVSVQELLEQRRALDQLVYQETKALDPKMRVQALRDVRAEMESVITQALDDASGKMKGELAAEYKGLKHDYHALRILGEAAEDSAARASKGATFGLTDKMAAFSGLASGGLSSSALLGVGSKLVRERGNAAAAVLLYRMAEMGTITRTIQAIDQQLGRSAKGLLNPGTAAKVPSAPAQNPIAVAQRAQRQIANLSSSPNAVANRAQTVTQGLSQAAPTVAGKVATNMTRALAFLNSKLPPNRVVDPLNPNQQRTWTQTEAAKFARYVEAAEDPIGTLQDIERGKVTPEAVETLRVLTPTLYRDLQVKTLDALAEQMATGKPVTFETRIKLGTLLGIQADPSLNPKVRAFLQANVAPAAAAMTAGGTMQPNAGPAPKPIQLKTQHSAFDRLAENGPGRR